MDMSSRPGLTLIAGTLVLGSAACAPVDPGFGETVKYAAAAQTIDPDPVYGPDGAQPGDNGDKGAHAVKRYRSDAVKAVETMQTNSGSSSGGSGPQ
jgi:hypothetical protein